MDGERAQQFALKVLGIYTGGVLSGLIDVGHQTGLFDAAAAGPATSEELADRAHLDERYVREWLGGMTTAEIFEYDAASKRYALPEEHAALLTGASARNLAPLAGLVPLFGQTQEDLVRAFREGGGVPYSSFRPGFTNLMDDAWRRIYDEQLIDGFLPAVDGVADRLRSGLRVADIGCGTGHALNLMAAEYPESTFTGYDIATDAIEAARAEAAVLGLANAVFEVLDVTQLPSEPAFDLITAFDSIHDQVDPATVLRRAHDALTPDGVFLMIGFKFSSDVAENVGNPFAAFYYGVSTMHCMTVSLAEGGMGLGTVWGIETARRMLSEAGFGSIEVVDSPRPQNCIYVCRP